MNRNQLLAEAFRALSDPKTMEALQAATAPMVSRLEEMRTQAKANGTDPLTSLYEMFDKVTGATVSDFADKPKAEETQQAPDLVIVKNAVEALRGRIGKVFVHDKTGNCYTLVALTNTKSTDQDKFPTSVNYLDYLNETVWSRPILEFVEKFSETV